MRRVIKIGGSLLTRRDLIASLPHWIDAQSRAENLCIVGGGELIDAIRRIDEVHTTDPEQIHWLCVDLLQSTFRLVSSWFDWPTITTEDEWRASLKSGFPRWSPTWISVTSFYNAKAASRFSIPLPHDWRTTTDSIAAWLAIHASADELVLLKSCEVDPDATPQQLAEQRVVDEVFPAIATKLPRIRIERLSP